MRVPSVPEGRYRAEAPSARVQAEPRQAPPMRAALALAQRLLLGAQSGENGNTRSRPLCSGVTAIHDNCPSQSRARSSPDALRSRFGISVPRRRFIALRAEQEQLRKILPTARKWKVGERPCYRHQADNEDPQLPLPRCKGLPVDAGNRAIKNDQPNRGKAHPNLAVELRGVQTTTGKNFAHGLITRFCPSLTGPVRTFYVEDRMQFCNENRANCNFLPDHCRK